MSKIEELIQAGWSRELAWIAGVVYGRGVVTPQAVAVSIGGDSEEQSQAFLALWAVAVGTDAPIRRRKGTKCSFEVESYDLSFVKWVQRLWPGSTQGWPEGLPTDLNADFLRGVWDSSGSIKLQELAGKSPRLMLSMFRIDELFMDAVCEKLAEAGVPVKLQKQKKQSGTYLVVQVVNATALRMAEWLYELAPSGMRHESKWSVYRDFRGRIAAGCTECGGAIHKAGFCRDHWINNRWPVTAKDKDCVECGAKGTYARSLCGPCYGRDQEAVVLARGAHCACGAPMAYGPECPKCASANRRAKAKEGAFGKCLKCQENVEIAGLCRKCYDKSVYAAQVHGAE